MSRPMSIAALSLLVTAAGLTACDREPTDVDAHVAQVCRGDAPAGDPLARFVGDADRPKVQRLVTLRDAAARAGVVQCPRLDALARFERPPPPEPLRPPSPSAGGPGRPSKASIRVTADDVAIDGPCRETDVHRVLQTRRRGVIYCYEKQLAMHASSQGRLEVGLTIGWNGHVERAELESSTLDAETLHGCVTRQMRRWRFPAPDDGTCRITVGYHMRTAR